VTQTVSVTHDGRTVHLEYRPEAVPTDKGRSLDRQMHDVLDEDEGRALHRQALRRILVGWDLTGPGGETVPLTDAGFDRHVSWFLERLIMQSIIRHQQHASRADTRRRTGVGRMSSGGRQPSAAQRTCACCGKPFPLLTRSVKYCTPRCRQTAEDKRRGKPARSGHDYPRVR
jgi:hypothetical protein